MNDMENNSILVNTKLKDDANFEVEYEIIQPSTRHNFYSTQHQWIQSQIDEIDLLINNEMNSIDELSNDIGKYTADLDKWDYALSVASGLLCGIIDSFAIGKFDLDSARELVGKDMENEIIGLAQKQGWEGVEKGTRKGSFPLDKAIAFLENKFKMPSDPLKDVFGGSRQHHLRDFAHHHSPIGLFFSVLTQFTGKAYGTDTNGMFIMVDVAKEMIGKDYRRKWAIAVTDWTLHLASDMDGSNATAGAGCGVPGPIVSLIKALSALPIFNKNNTKPGDNKLSLFAAKLYNGTLLGSKDENGKLCPVKIDLRGEKAIKHELGKQNIPVIINEVLVRVYYLIRRLYIELKVTQIQSWNDIIKLDWAKIVPYGNRSIARMMTIASGTFVAIDLADASIRGAIASGGEPITFAKEMLLRVNFIGIGRFAIAIGTDVNMGIKCKRLREERQDVTQQLLINSNAKLYYHQADLWIDILQSQQKINELYEYAYKVTPIVYTLCEQIGNDFHELPQQMQGIHKHNPGLANYIKQTLK